MGKLWIFCSLLVCLFAFVTKYLYDLGAFRQIKRIGSDRCRLLQPDDGSKSINEKFVKMNCNRESF